MQKSPISWVGGKSKLVETLKEYIPAHAGYIEVFGGAAWLLFSKPRSKWEVLNDFDGDLMNFWSVVKEAPEQFINSFNYTLISRKTFEEYKEIYKKGEYEDCIKRAHIFYYLVRAGFAAKLTHPSFGTAKGPSNLRLDKIEEDIYRAYERLKNVTIENLSYEKIFELYDSAESFFFLDPPYRNACKYAAGDFTDEQYAEVATLCLNMKGQVLITINDDEFIRKQFKEFEIKEQGVQYSLSKKSSGRRKYGELIITNYKKPGQIRLNI